MMQFATHQCRTHGHPEFTLQFAQRRPIPIEEMLLAHLERAVSAGVRYTPGQNVQVGWAQLRVCERSDGTLGLHERDGEEWVERCDRSLMYTWLQNEVVSSLGISDRINFPRQDQVAVVCDRVHKTSAWLLARRPCRNSDDSGWYMRCLDDSHNHERTSALETHALHTLASHFPFATQFLALPVGCDVVIDGTQPLIQSRIYIHGVHRIPTPGSYLASRQPASSQRPARRSQELAAAFG